MSTDKKILREMRIMNGRRDGGPVFRYLVGLAFLALLFLCLAGVVHL